MTWKTILSKESEKYLKKIDAKTQRRVIKALRELEKMENPALHRGVRPLTGDLKEKYRLRVGNLRVIFGLGSKVIKVYALLPRGRAYKR
jgi:mRNA-degrading endonuclease RelE of RelBE toxin-antitoxin system